MLVMVITAPAMEAPEGSVTSPEREARNSCALSTPAIKTKEASASLFHKKPPFTTQSGHVFYPRNGS